MSKRGSGRSKGHHATILGHKAFAAISAVEGLKLTPRGRERVHKNTPTEQRRADVIRTYTGGKDPR
jgi:hypothetical protein